MISLNPIRKAKLTVLARAARVRQRVILHIRGASKTRVFEPHHRYDAKNGNVTYFGVDTLTKQVRQFDIDNIMDVQIANGRNRFTK